MIRESIHLRVLFATLGILFLCAYVLFQARNLILGPLVTLSFPTDGQTLTSAIATIEGSAHNITSISLNDRQIFVDQEGKFQETLFFPMGYTIVEVKARDRFGREVVDYLEVTRIQ